MCHAVGLEKINLIQREIRITLITNLILILKKIQKTSTTDVVWILK